MAARNKPSPFQRGLRAVRHNPSHRARRESSRRDRDRAFNADDHPLWTRTFESQWHRFLCKTTNSTTFH